ncbi:hypothetical protein SHELI_v1c09540 [Spiroplasma helicoides]|uniref:AAA+ ATPase domain-containing protein n=1 Tax=Spiroplasma helicoides TaxID=216938 RepID=A0A1B3SLV2_9MOLU|nr:AAA domain-containing protein [Spiroplasma helicoides]AOG60903.1 hypothetical protein SHELI_v1c09540 [Spiroplasma helicoides]
MKTQFKLKYTDNLNKKDEWQDIVEGLYGSDCLEVKFTTKQLEIEYDRKDETQIKGIRNVEIILNYTKGVVILKCSVQCSYTNPFGGEVFVFNFRKLDNVEFEKLKGCKKSIEFVHTNPSSIEDTKEFLNDLIDDDNFEFNISQFDEFMEIFHFYKELYNEINNNENYEIKDISEKIKFISVDCKELFENDGSLKDVYTDLITMYDERDMIMGYEAPLNVYSRMPNNIKNKVEEIIIIDIENKKGRYAKLSRAKENIFASNFQNIDSKNSNNIKQLDVMNVIENKSIIEIYVKVDQKNELEYSFINLYDKGQEIKIESIDNSLRLINQGNSSAAINLIEYLIGDETIPNNHINFIASEVTNEYTKNLNESQREAFLKAIDGSPITLIKGPPGTGKTHVINAIVQYITKELKEKVIISSQTHVAIDNVLDKLFENKDPIIPKRITNKINRYSESQLDETLYNTWGQKISNWLEDYENVSIKNNILNDLNNFKGENLLNYTSSSNPDYLVIGATTTTTAISGKKGLEVLKDYNWLIIDEVSKCPITEVLRYLPYVEKIILVGDDYQLAPLLEFNKDEVKHLKSFDEDKFDQLEKIYRESVFSKTIKKAEQSDRLIMLDINYRSCPQIFGAYNIFYDNQLTGYRNGINDKKVYFKNDSYLNNEKDIYFLEPLNGTDTSNPGSTSRFNVQESKAISKVLTEVLEKCDNPNNTTVSIIFPYKDQLKLFINENKPLINKVKKTFKSFEIDTVDAFQGRETDIVLVSTVVTDLTKKTFLEDFRRINVALSRARDKLFLFGSRNLEKLEMKAPNSNKRKYLGEIIGTIKKYEGYLQISVEGEIIDVKGNSSFKFT